MKRKTLAVVLLALMATPLSALADKPPYQCLSVKPVPAAAPIQGGTPQAIDAAFTGIIEQNFRTGNTPSLVQHLSDRELADLATLYAHNAGNDASTLLNILARSADATTLQRVASAFGQEATETAVNQYATPAVVAAFANAGPAPALTRSSLLSPSVAKGAVMAAAGPAPTTDMTLYEIYLEFRTAPVGSLSVESALSESAIFAASKIAPYAGAGYAVGTVVSELIQTYDPDLDDAIGGTISNALDNVSNAATDLEQGQTEQALDDLFGAPVSDSGNPFGDYGNSDPMGDYESGSDGGC